MEDNEKKLEKSNSMFESYQQASARMLRYDKKFVRDLLVKIIESIWLPLDVPRVPTWEDLMLTGNFRRESATYELLTDRLNVALREAGQVSLAEEPSFIHNAVNTLWDMLILEFKMKTLQTAYVDHVCGLRSNHVDRQWVRLNAVYDEDTDFGAALKVWLGQDPENFKFIDENIVKLLEEGNTKFPFRRVYFMDSDLFKDPEQVVDFNALLEGFNPIRRMIFSIRTANNISNQKVSLVFGETSSLSIDYSRWNSSGVTK